MLKMQKIENMQRRSRWREEKVKRAKEDEANIGGGELKVGVLKNLVLGCRRFGRPANK